jgi:hypothetical protein
MVYHAAVVKVVENGAMSILSKINGFFRTRPLNEDQQRMLEQLQTNRAKAVYIVPEVLWKEFLYSVYSDSRLKYIAIRTFTNPASIGAYRSEYVSGHLHACLGFGSFATRLTASGVDPKRVINVMLENLT